MKIKTNLSFTSLTKALLVITLVISSVYPVTNAKANDEIESRFKVIECHDEVIYQRYASKLYYYTGFSLAPGGTFSFEKGADFSYSNSNSVGADFEIIKSQITTSYTIGVHFSTTQTTHNPFSEARPVVVFLTGKYYRVKNWENDTPSSCKLVSDREHFVVNGIGFAVEGNY